MKSKRKFDKIEEIKEAIPLTNEQHIQFIDLNSEQASKLLGPQDENLTVLSSCFDKTIVFRNQDFIVDQCDELTLNQVHEVVQALIDLVKQGQDVTSRDVLYAYKLVVKREPMTLAELSHKVIGKTVDGKRIAPKTVGQHGFVEAMEHYDIVFAIGPAGTGKTYLAVVEAVAMLKKGTVKKIVLTRPAVEAGESLGFLPGDLKEKVDPYLTPLYDALHAMLGVEQTNKYIEKGIIEIAPLAYMRGRTLDDAFVILDEAQNTTVSQMKMFLTRLGFDSRMVITGDVTQIDLNKGQKSGLVDSAALLTDVPEIKILHLTSEDVVRHPLVQKIIDCYAKKGY